jgi:hypothetical protein
MNGIRDLKKRGKNKDTLVKSERLCDYKGTDTRRQTELLLHRKGLFKYNLLLDDWLIHTGSNYCYL